MIKYLIYFITAAAISLLLTPLIRILARKTNVLDYPSKRKIHHKPIPLLGGIPIFFSLNLTLLLGVILNNVYIKEFLLPRWKTILACQIIVLTLGVFDDIKKLKPGVKLGFQIIAGALLVLFGFSIDAVANPFSGNIIHLGIFAVPLTILWVVGITNALNLVDGLDGLAAGTSVIVCATVFGIAFLNQNIGIAFVSLILAGSILGFLRYNFHPAKIFLGDSGSLLLGLLLAVLSIEGSSKGAILVAVLVPVLALGFPIMDTMLSMARRLFKSIVLVNRPTENGTSKSLFFKNFSLFDADEDHIHHRILKLGFSHKKTVMILYGICAVLCVFAFLSQVLSSLSVTVFLIAIIVAFFIGVKSLNYPEFKILENGLLIPIFTANLLSKKIFLTFFDLAAVSLSYYLSFILVFGGFSTQTRLLYIQTLPVLLALKIIVFYLSGLYKGTWQYSGIEDIVKILKALVLSSIGVLFVAVIFFGIRPFGGIIFFVMDFYLLLTFVIGVRTSHIAVNFFYRRSSASEKKKIIIYGAGARGSILFKEIRRNGSYFSAPVGFIDDDVKKKGKFLHDCPILGTIKNLSNIVRKHEVSEIIVSTDKIGREKIEKLTEFCKKRDIILRQFEFRFYEFP